MEVTKTVVCKLDCTREEHEKLLRTVEAFRDACNYISEIAWQERAFHPVVLHHLTYRKVREKFKLPANLAIRSRDRVARSYKGDRSKAHRFNHLSMDLDKRLYTLLRNGGFRVSITTLWRRVKPRLAIGDHQRELLKNPTREAKLVYRRDTNEFYIHVVVRVKVPEPQG